jgi:hypothetical protein
MEKKGQAEMAEQQRVPNLEEMNEREAHRFLIELFSNLSAQEEYELRHQDYVMEMPQSGESIRGRQKMREFQEAYPTPPSISRAECWSGMGCGSLRDQRLRRRADIRRGANHRAARGEDVAGQTLLR